MIGYLQGQILSKNQNTIILLCGGIGYEVYINDYLKDKLEIKDEISLYIHTKVREDDISLFGFESKSQLDFFRQLINVNGIGPKTGLEIMNNDIDLIKNAIIQENTLILSKIPDIGKKTAERIILDLKGKISPDNLQDLSSQTNQTFNELLEALMSLGYQRSEVYKIMKNSPTNLDTLEEQVKYFLKNI